MKTPSEFATDQRWDFSVDGPAVRMLEARDAEWRRLVEEAQQRSATWQHNHEDALKAAEEARADAKRNALSNIELRIEVDRLKGELAEARRLLKDARLRLHPGSNIANEVDAHFAAIPEQERPSPKCGRCGNNVGKVVTVAGRRHFQCGFADCWPPAPIETAEQAQEEGAQLRAIALLNRELISTYGPSVISYAIESAAQSAYAAGIARGRELGARHENKVCEALVHSSADIGVAVERIEARRAGRGTL